MMYRVTGFSAAFVCALCCFTDLAMAQTTPDDSAAPAGEAAVLPDETAPSVVPANGSSLTTTDPEGVELNPQSSANTVLANGERQPAPAVTAGEAAKLPTVFVDASANRTATDTAGTRTLDAIVVPGAAAQNVTARKRIDQVKDVPFGVAVKTGKELNSRGVYRIPEAIRDVPNVNIQGFGDGRSTSFFVRGIGALRDPLSPDDTSFVVYVDGVPQPLFASDVGFLDINQVELLKGPQGTLFGRNTTAGALNVTTVKPTMTPQYSLRAEVGEDGHVLTEGIASGPIVTDVLAGRVALRFSDIDGFVPNISTGTDLGAQNIVSGRGTLLYTPSDKTKLTLSFFADRDERTFPFFILKNTPIFPTAAALKDNQSARTVKSVTAIFETETNATQFKSTTNVAQLRTKDLFVDDTDGIAFARITGLPVSVFSINNAFTDWDEKRSTFSQEFLFSSLPEAALSWVVGASYFASQFEADYLNVNDPFPLLSGKRRNELKSHSFSAFGETTVPIGDRWRVTTGARLSHDAKSYDLKYTGVGTPGTVDTFRDTGNLDFTYLTGRASLSYALNSESTAYFTVSRGFKSGGYPRLAIDAAIGSATQPYKASKTWTYEAGYKVHAMDKSSFLEFAAFFNDVKDEHVLAFDPLVFGFRPENLDVQTYGVEVSAGQKLSDVLSVSGAAGYTHAELVNIDPADPVAGARNGNHPTNVPAFTASAALNYRQSVSALGVEGVPGQVFAHASWEFIGKRAADVANAFFLDSYHQVAARVGYEPRKNTQVYLFGKNLLDETPQLAGAFSPPNAEVAVPGRGRVLGLGSLITW